MHARIFKPTKTAMQSGKAKTNEWILEFEAEAARRIDPLMGWTSGADTLAGQVRLHFETCEAAVEYAEARGIPHRVLPEHAATPQPKAYADNFAFRRRKPWTH
ncbi:MAG: ETC complex I subunit [Pseudomonadota bacterium]